MSIIFIMLIVLVLRITIWRSANQQDVIITKTIGNIQNTNINITYCGKENPFDDMLSYGINGSNVNEINNHNVRCSVGFADIVPIDEYVLKNNITSEEFCQKYGFLYMYTSNKGKNYYLLQDTFGNSPCWNLLIEDSGKWDFIKLCNTEKETQDSFRFALKMEFKEDDLYIYLDSCLCIVNNKNEISIINWNLNELFLEICNQDIRTHNSKVKYIDGNLYLIASTEKYKDYFVIKYDTKNRYIQKYKTNHSAQEVLEFDNEVIIISINENKIFLEKFSDNSLKCAEISSVTKLNLEHFKKNTSLTEVIEYGTGFYLALANADDSNPKNYIFNISYNNLELIGFKEIKLINKNYNLYGINFFIL